MSVNKPVHIKVIIILSKGIDQHLGNFEPSHVKEELEKGEHRDYQINLNKLNEAIEQRIGVTA